MMERELRRYLKQDELEMLARDATATSPPWCVKYLTPERNRAEITQVGTDVVVCRSDMAEEDTLFIANARADLRTLLQRLTETRHALRAVWMVANGSSRETNRADRCRQIRNNLGIPLIGICPECKRRDEVENIAAPRSA